MPNFSKPGNNVVCYAGFLRKADIFDSFFSLAKKSRWKSHKLLNVHLTCKHGIKARSNRPYMSN